MVARGKKEVSDVNVENALTVADKKRNWEAYFVEAIKKPSFVYGDRNNHGRKFFYDLKQDKVQSVLVGDFQGSVKIYLGNLDRQDWYAEDEKSNPIDSLDHRDLENKTVYFIKTT
jgi:hypothetical protein